MVPGLTWAFPYDQIADPIIMGDLNDDNELNVQDVILFVNFILATSTEINIYFADLNEDGNIDVFDVILVINIILNDNL